MKIVNLREHIEFLHDYVALRNQYAEQLCSCLMSIEETYQWLHHQKVEVFLMIEDKTLLGVGILYLHKMGEVTLFVQEKNRGIASMLLHYIIQHGEAVNISKMWAWISTENKISQRVFTKYGFVLIKQKTKKYSNHLCEGLIYELSSN